MQTADHVYTPFIAIGSLPHIRIELIRIYTYHFVMQPIMS